MRLLSCLFAAALLPLPALAADAQIRVKPNSEMALGSFSDDSGAAPGAGIFLACLPALTNQVSSVTISFGKNSGQQQTVNIGECFMFAAFGTIKVKNTSSAPAILALSV